jgi:hypothetical protein
VDADKLYKVIAPKPVVEEEVEAEEQKPKVVVKKSGKKVVIMGTPITLMKK